MTPNGTDLSFSSFSAQPICERSFCNASQLTFASSLPLVCYRAAATKMSLDASAVAYVAVETEQTAAACKLAGVQLLSTSCVEV